MQKIEFIEDLENVTEEQLRRLLTDKLYRLNNLYHIRNKDGQIVRFRLNQEQTEYILNRHNRNIILKARQIGFSTLAVIDGQDDCLFESNFNAGIIAYSLDDAEKLMDKAKLALEKLPGWIRKYRTPINDSVGELKFSNGSVFNVDTSYRGGTLSRLHVSEFGKIASAFPKKAREIIAGAFEAVPINGFIDIESTAEGSTGSFYNLCQTAMSKGGESELTSLEFKFHFYSWWQNPEYSIDSSVRIKSELEVYFDYLEKEHGIKLTQGQKNWYALKEETQQDLMPQEYPSYPEEAFLASGRSYFNQKQLSGDIKRSKGIEYKRGYLDNDGFKADPKGNLTVYKMPSMDEAYSIGADVAEGLVLGDFSTASVLNKKFEQVAAYKGHLDPDLFGRFLVSLAKFYNQALIAPELNNHGHATLAAIKNAEYYNIYQRVVSDKLGDDIQEKVGWLNNKKSKMKMLDDFKEAYRDKSLILNDEATLREMSTVVIEDDGSVILNGKDLTVATGLAIQGLSQAYLPTDTGAFESSEGTQAFKNKKDFLSYRREEDETTF